MCAHWHCKTDPQLQTMNKNILSNYAYNYVPVPLVVSAVACA